ncbi:cholesterol 7-alpha-monooxygenase-like [Pontoporia blainvillei]|uniref:Cholesterol 7-alpha-monooxygenase-like n=1 Tax=Pontoporia blainvillei TaxID=48723 RepID=A0ABX0S1C2_PONBL|nr:cholesterol 7-alpha-monooxygenase-like [Pontoporia blainvillei]
MSFLDKLRKAQIKTLLLRGFALDLQNDERLFDLGDCYSSVLLLVASPWNEKKAFGHRSIDPSDGNTIHNISKTIIKTLQGDALNSLTEAMMENLQLVLRPQVVPKPKTPAWMSEGMYAFCYRVMFEAGYFTLFGKDPTGQDAQKALILNHLDHFKQFDKIFPALVAGFPIHMFKTGHYAREKLAEGLRLQKLRKRDHISELVRFLNDTLSALDDTEKAKSFLAVLWASQANTIPATFWSLFQMIR